MEATHFSTLPTDDYRRENRQILLELSAAGISHNYTRVAISDKFSTPDLKSWDSEMALWQRLRIRSAQMRENIGAGGGSDEMIGMDSESEGGGMGGGGMDSD